MTKERRKKDVIIIGAGMAGLTAALYAGRSNLSTLVLENAIVGGQISNAVGIENYPGLLNVSGSDLVATVQQQAENAGAEVDEFDMIERVNLTGTPKIVETQSYIYEAKAVIITSGMERRKLPLKEEAKYSGRGVHYCELCDGHMYQGKTIAVMGGGNAAVDAANFLTKYASELYLIHRSALRADKISQDKLYANPKVKVLLETEVKALHGEGKLTSITIYDKAKGEERELPVDAIFVNIGVVPNTHLFEGQVKMTESGRILAGEDCRTNLPGVFAAGDIRVKSLRQVVTAAADGAIAAMQAEKFINE